MNCRRNPHLPNEFHIQQKLRGGRIHENRKRKESIPRHSKYKEKYDY